MSMTIMGKVSCDQCSASADLREELDDTNFRSFSVAYRTEDRGQLSEFLLNCSTPMLFPATRLDIQLAGGCDPDLILCFECCDREFRQEYVALIDPREHDLFARQYAAGKLEDLPIKLSIREGIEQLISEDDAAGYFYMGLIFWFGNEAPRSERQAFEYFLKAAEKGHAEAMCLVAISYEAGNGTDVDASQGRIWHERAFRAGWIQSAFILGCHYDIGRGVKEDKAIASMWYQKAADAGYAQAQHSIAVNYDNGYGVPVNKELAFRYYLMAANQNVKAAVYNLAVCYRDGEGTAQDLDKFLQWNKVFSSLPDE